MDNFDKIESMIQVGIQQLCEKDFDKAINTFNRVLILYPECLTAYQYKAICQSELFDTHEFTIQEAKNYLENIKVNLHKAIDIVDYHVKKIDKY